MNLGIERPAKWLLGRHFQIGESGVTKASQRFYKLLKNNREIREMVESIFVMVLDYQMRRPDPTIFLYTLLCHLGPRSRVSVFASNSENLMFSM